MRRFWLVLLFLLPVSQVSAQDTVWSVWVYDAGQGGLLDIALHPDYENTGWLYLTYASEGGIGEGGHTRLFRAKLEGNTLTSN